MLAQTGVERAHRTVKLPYYWDRDYPGEGGEAEFQVRFSLSADALSVPQGIYLDRVGNRAELWLNGNLLARIGNMDLPNREDHTKTPQYVLVPPNFLQVDNVLRVRVEADAGRRGGLSVVRVGPADGLRERHLMKQRWLVQGGVVIAVFSLVVGVIALVLWLTQSQRDSQGIMRRDGLYLSAAVAELCWFIRVGDRVIETTPLDWPWWGLVYNAAYAGWIGSVALFCHMVAGWHRHRSMPWFRWGIVVLMLASPLTSYLALFEHRPIYMAAWYGCAAVLFLGYSVFYIAATLQHPDTARVLVTVAGVLNVLAGARDWIVVYGFKDTEALSWMRYSSVLIGLALGSIVIMRFRQTSLQARDLMDNMAEKVRQKEQELATSYQKLEQLAREQERTAERARVLRDMHDGVGSHISTAIRQLQSGKARDEELLQTLRDSLDQLKLSIDAMSLAPGDLNAMLASLRYRLEPRFKASDIALVWLVDLVPPVQRLDAAAMRHLQYMVFEALSNVLQHAQASELRIELHAAATGGAVLRVIDNGRGFDTGRGGRNGLASLRERAQAVGAQLRIDSRPGRTEVEIGIP